MKNDKLNILSSICGISISLFLTYAMMMLAPAAYAQVAKPSIDFNHMKTGFPLTGTHARVECETCHVGGLFRGTPTNCEGCHTPGRRVLAPVKSISHMPTTEACNTCHLNAVSFLGARFNHIGVLPKGCASCHNGKTAPGKPNGHVVTTLPCDTCHRTSAWLPSGFSHATVVGGSCETCHTPGGMGRAKPVTHLPTTAPCDACHKSGFTTFLGAPFDHLGSTIVTTNNCATCHLTGQYGAKTKPQNHIPTASVSCNVCHTTGYISFVGPIMSHTLVEASIQCSTCHNGSYKQQMGSLGLGAQSKADKANHVATTAECGTCHLGRTTFLGANYTHGTGVTVLNLCDTCHKVGGPGISKPVTHVSTALQCDSSGCHTPTNYITFAGIGYTHDAASIGKCGTCHLGQNTTAKQKPITHIPTIGNACDSCHVYVPSGNGPTGGFLANLPTKAQIHAVSVPAIACATCHSGGYANVKSRNSATHVATTAACDNCHTLSNTRNYTDFLGATFNHASVTTTSICGTCHTPGGSGLAKTTPPHIPTTGNACDACHSVTKPTFAGATMNHLNVASQKCITCHGTGNIYSTTSPALVKMATPPHIPTTTIACEGCHTNTSVFAAVMSHAVVTGIPCSTCHNGSYTSQGQQYGGAKALPPNHVSTTKECSVCHVGSGSWTSWNHPPEKMDHVTNLNTGDCLTCHLSPNPVLGSMTKKPLPSNNPSEHNIAPKNCSNSGCHRPLGSKGSLYSTWN